MHKTVTVGSNLHNLIYNVLTWHCFFSQGYAQHKGFNHFNGTSTGGMKIDQSRKMDHKNYKRYIKPNLILLFKGNWLIYKEV